MPIVVCVVTLGVVPSKDVVEVETMSDVLHELTEVDITEFEGTETVPETTTEEKNKNRETTTVKIPETTTKAIITTTEMSTSASESASKADGAYTFKELGISQISNIPVPDDILFDKNGIPLNYSRKLTGKSTAYCMGHTTATGTSVHPGVVAVNPKIIPYGTKMYIVANDGTVYGYSSAEDTGGFIYWNNPPIVDLYVNTTNFAYQWGNRSVTIYIF